MSTGPIPGSHHRRLGLSSVDCGVGGSSGSGGSSFKCSSLSSLGLGSLGIGIVGVDGRYVVGSVGGVWVGWWRRVVGATGHSHGFGLDLGRLRQLRLRLLRLWRLLRLLWLLWLLWLLRLLWLRHRRLRRRGQQDWRRRRLACIPRLHRLQQRLICTNPN